LPAQAAEVGEVHLEREGEVHVIRLAVVSVGQVGDERRVLVVLQDAVPVGVALVECVEARLAGVTPVVCAVVPIRYRLEHVTTVLLPRLLDVLRDIIGPRLGDGRMLKDAHCGRRELYSFHFSVRPLLMFAPRNFPGSSPLCYPTMPPSSSIEIDPSAFHHGQREHLLAAPLSSGL